MRLENPILRGFNADPSMLRHGDDFYIATSTFEWFPGVQILHSRDLVNWHIAARPLSRLSQLDMRGDPNSGGIWAPCLSWADGQFHLIYTDVKRWTGAFKDSHNFLVTSPTIEGPWSEPVYLNSSGFDASLFHDEGKKWLVNMRWDFRAHHNSFSGILLQEYDAKAKKLVGPVKNIFSGTELGLVEGPHLYKKDGWYYLLTAEGGTFQTHAVTIARSKVIEGPYEVMPHNPLLTSARDPSLALQSAGHGSLVELKDGSWLLAHLCRRPIVKGRSTLGRETALQSVVWDEDGWPRLASGKVGPSVAVTVPDYPAKPWPTTLGRDDFDAAELSLVYQSLRAPLGSDASLAARKGFLRLKGRESIQSHHQQTLVARRVSAFKVSAETAIEFSPQTFQELAGLVAFYSTENFYYLYLTHNEHSQRCIGLMASNKGNVSFLIEKEFPLDTFERVYLKVEIDHADLRFWYSVDGKAWRPAGDVLDASVLSDEYATPCGFTGAFVGVACQDLSGRGNHADFDYFDYQEHV